MVIGVIAIVAGVCLLLVVRGLARVQARSAPYALDWLFGGLRVILALVALLFVGAGVFFIARPPHPHVGGGPGSVEQPRRPTGGH